MKIIELISLKIFNLWDPVDDMNFWEATIEIPNTYSLFEFHLFIQRIICFGNDHSFDFYAGRSYGNRKILFSEISGNPFDSGEYENILLKNVYPLKGLKLYYKFDFGDNWVFEIHKNRKTIKIDEKFQYPRIVSDNRIRLRQYYNEDE